MYTYDILQFQVSLHTLINMYLIGCMSASRNNDVLCFKVFTIPLFLHSYVAFICHLILGYILLVPLGSAHTAFFWLSLITWEQSGN
jgi:hypothetical protein